MPLVSIVTVTYNAALHLRQALDSILHQTYPNVELIVVDGGSTDATLDIIRGKEDKIDYWVSEPDGGIYHAMNKGLAMARGQWVGFKNADDWYTPDAVEQLIACASRQEADVWYGNTYSVISEAPIAVAPFYTNHRTLGSLPGIDHRSSFVKTALHKQIPFDLQYRLAADLDVYWRLKMNGAVFAHTQVFMAYKRYGGASDGTTILKEGFRINAKYKGIWWAFSNRAAIRFRYYAWKTSNMILKMILGEDGYRKFKSRKIRNQKRG